jgi:hypothetical protein
MQDNIEIDTRKKLQLDENTSSEKLRKFAKSNDELTRMAVVKHPNTPPDILLGLFSEFPNLVLEHPLLDFILLEKPNFLTQLCDEYRDVFYDDNELPLFFLEWAANHPDIEIRKSVPKNK